MKKLLFQLDTDAIPAAFDTVVGYDGGADHVTAYGGITPHNVGALVDGAIFTRAPKDKKLTAKMTAGLSADLVIGAALTAYVMAYAKFLGMGADTRYDWTLAQTTFPTGIQFKLAAHINAILKSEESTAAISSFVTRRVDDVLGKRVSEVMSISEEFLMPSI